MEKQEEFHYARIGIPAGWVVTARDDDGNRFVPVRNEEDGPVVDLVFFEYRDGHPEGLVENLERVANDIDNLIGAVLDGDEG